MTIGTAARRILGVWVILAVAAFVGAEAARAENVTTTHKDITLNGNLVLADGKKLTDGVVLMTHGTLAHNGMEVIATMQRVLAERELNSLAVTLGLGVSDRKGAYDCKVTHRHRHTGALDEIGTWLAWLKEKGVKKVVLMGHSRGGNQSAWFAAQRPDPMISHVVLLAPGTWSKEKDRASYQKQHGTSIEPVLKEAEELVKAGKAAQVFSKTGILYCKDAEVTAETVVSYYRPDDRFHTPNLLSKITVPTLVVAGSADKVVAGLIEATKPLVDGKKVQLNVIEDADHFFRDFFAEDAGDAIAAFLAGEG